MTTMLRDLHVIREYIAKNSERYADLTVARIFSAVSPILFRNRTKVRTGL